MFVCCILLSVNMTCILFKLLMWKEQQRGGFAVRRGLSREGSCAKPGTNFVSRLQKEGDEGFESCRVLPAKLLPAVGGAELRGGRDFAGTPLWCRGAAPRRRDGTARQPGQIPASTDR